MRRHMSFVKRGRARSMQPISGTAWHDCVCPLRPQQAPPGTMGNERVLRIGNWAVVETQADGPGRLGPPCRLAASAGNAFSAWGGGLEKNKLEASPYPLHSERMSVHSLCASRARSLCAWPFEPLGMTRRRRQRQAGQQVGNSITKRPSFRPDLGTPDCPSFSALDEAPMAGLPADAVLLCGLPSTRDGGIHRRRAPFPTSPGSKGNASWASRRNSSAEAPRK